jgi:hypothetical protein
MNLGHVVCSFCLDVDPVVSDMDLGRNVHVGTNQTTSAKVSIGEGGFMWHLSCQPGHGAVSGFSNNDILLVYNVVGEHVLLHLHEGRHEGGLGVTDDGTCIRDEKVLPSVPSS